MGLETGTTIADLVVTNPVTGDSVTQGDDHLRLIKTVMTSITFFKSIQSFTANGTWTRPTGIKRILIACIGGGAGGGGGLAAGYSGGGGSGGGLAVKWLDVSSIASATVEIGAGGAGGGATGLVGASGGDTSFITAGPIIQCQGRRGIAGAAYPDGGVADPRTNNMGDLKFVGGDGQTGWNISTGSSGGQGGGQGGSRGGGNAQSAQANTGGGGGGGGMTSGAAGAGGSGGSGYCFVFEFGW